MSEDEAKTAAPYHPPWERRGTDPSRLLSLADGIFGFAMTLLVLSVALPFIPPPGGQYPPLFGPRELGSPSFQSAILSFILVFIILASYWRAHHLLFHYIRGWDTTVVQLTMLFLAMIVLQPFLVHIINIYSGSFGAVFLYASLSALTGLALCATWEHVVRDKHLLPPKIDAEGIRWLRISLYLTPGIFAASILIALVNPVLAEFSWVAVFVAQTLHVRGGRWRHRNRAAPQAPAPLP